jgi:hypothetical protein
MEMMTVEKTIIGGGFVYDFPSSIFQQHIHSRQEHP